MSLTNFNQKKSTDVNQKKSLVITDFNEKKYHDLQLVIDPTQKTECSIFWARVQYAKNRAGKTYGNVKDAVIKTLGNIDQKNKNTIHNGQLSLWLNITLIEVVIANKELRKFLKLDKKIKGKIERTIKRKNDLQQSLNICSIILMKIANNHSIEKNQVIEIQKTLFTLYRTILQQSIIAFGIMQSAVLDNAVNSIQTMLNKLSSKSPSYDVLRMMQALFVITMPINDINYKQTAAETLKDLIKKYLHTASSALHDLYDKTPFLKVNDALNKKKIFAIVYFLSLNRDTMLDNEIKIIEKLNSVFIESLATRQPIIALLSLEFFIQCFLQYEFLQVPKIYKLIAHITQKLSFYRLNIDRYSCKQYFPDLNPSLYEAIDNNTKRLLSHSPNINNDNSNQYFSRYILYIYRFWYLLISTFNQEFKITILLPGKHLDQKHVQNLLKIQVTIINNFSNAKNLSLFDKFITSKPMLEAMSRGSYSDKCIQIARYIMIADLLIKGMEEPMASICIDDRIRSVNIAYDLYYNKLVIIMKTMVEKFYPIFRKALSELKDIKQLKSTKGITSFDLSYQRMIYLIAGYLREIKNHPAPKRIEYQIHTLFTHRPIGNTAKTVPADESCNSPKKP